MKAVCQFIGIDISKDHLDVHIRPDGRQQRFSYDPDGLAKLLEMISEVGPELIVMEATGGYEQRLVALLASERLPVAVVNAKRSRLR